MTVLEAPKELESLVGLFGKLYVYTFDCATFYSNRFPHGDISAIYGFDLRFVIAAPGFIITVFI